MKPPTAAPFRPVISLKECVKAAIRLNEYSPDIPFIQGSYSRVPVFIYGCERAGFSEYDALGSARRFGEGFTVEETFVLHLSSTNEPVAMSEHSDHRVTAAIKGELFSVTPSELFELDRHYMNTYYFQRRWKQVVYYDPKERSVKLKEWFSTQAFMYLGLPLQWQGRREKGQMRLMEMRTGHNQKAYYEYRRLDDIQAQKDRQKQCL